MTCLSPWLIRLKRMPILLSVFIFFLLFTTPILADSTCPSTVPRPESAGIDQIIAEAQSRGGAAANVPADVLNAIYSIEAGPYYAYPNSYNCPIKTDNYTNYLGPMAIGDLTLSDVVTTNERFLDINQETGMCAPNYCNKLSRCNPSDSMEIAARILLLKLDLWDKTNSKPLGSITTKEQIYNATCEYYGSFNPDKLTNALLADWKPWLPAGESIKGIPTLTYCEYILAYINQTPYYLTRGPQPLPPAPAPKPFTFKPYCNTTNQNPNISYLLRPNPNDLVDSEKQKTIDDPTLTPYCIQRPTTYQNIQYDKSLANPPIKFLGNLITNFSSFTTPFLNSDTQTSTLTDEEKAYQFLNQYLGDHPADNFETLGMFEKLAPKNYQDQLKIAMVNRALGFFTNSNNPYGFKPATPTVHDYPVACWDGSKIVDFTDPTKGTCGSNQQIKLSSFKDNLIPLNDPVALEVWKQKDNGKWFQAWLFIPKFTLEDTKGFIKTIPEPGQGDSQTTPVSHPFLAKTYELSSSLFYLLNPYQPPPMENYNTEQWYGPPWEEDPLWFKSDINQNQWQPTLGPVCDQTTPVIYGPGALAFGGIINNQVNYTTTISNTPDPNCVLTNTCIVTQLARYSPVYDESYTPFLKEINSNLYAPNGIFNLIEPYNPEKKDYFPAAASDHTATFTYSNGLAEAGMKQPGETAQFLYRYLGSIHCAKQKLINAIQPFFGGEIAISPECSGSNTVSNSSTSPFTDSDMVSPTNTDINQAASSCANTTHAWIYQYDDIWATTLSPADEARKTLGKPPLYPQCTIGLSGCGSVAVTEILSAFGNTDGVINVWNRQHELGGYVYRTGTNLDGSPNKYCLTNHGGAMSVLQEAGLSTVYISAGPTNINWTEAEKYLKNCGLIYASGTASWKTRNPSGHVVVITGIEKVGKTVVAIKTLDGATANGNGLTRKLMNNIPITYRDDYAYTITNLFAVVK